MHETGGHVEETARVVVGDIAAAFEVRSTPWNCPGATLLSCTLTSAASLRISGAVRSSILVTLPMKPPPPGTCTLTWPGGSAGIRRHMGVGQEHVGTAKPEHQPDRPGLAVAGDHQIAAAHVEADGFPPADLADVGRDQPLARAARRS